MKIRHLALQSAGLALCCPLLAGAGQEEARGFIEDSRINALVRNYYRNNDYRDRDKDGREWAGHNRDESTTASGFAFTSREAEDLSLTRARAPIASARPRTATSITSA